MCTRLATNDISDDESIVDEQVVLLVNSLPQPPPLDNSECRLHTYEMACVDSRVAAASSSNAIAISEQLHPSVAPITPRTSASTFWTPPRPGSPVMRRVWSVLCIEALCFKCSCRLQTAPGRRGLTFFSVRWASWVLSNRGRLKLERHPMAGECRWLVRPAIHRHTRKLYPQRFCLHRSPMLVKERRTASSSMHRCLAARQRMKRSSPRLDVAQQRCDLDFQRWRLSWYSIILPSFGTRRWSRWRLPRRRLLPTARSQASLKDPRRSHRQCRRRRDSQISEAAAWSSWPANHQRCFDVSFDAGLPTKSGRSLALLGLNLLSFRSCRPRSGAPHRSQTIHWCSSHLSSCSLSLLSTPNSLAIFLSPPPQTASDAIALTAVLIPPGQAHDHQAQVSDRQAGAGRQQGSRCAHVLRRHRVSGGPVVRCGPRRAHGMAP